MEAFLSFRYAKLKKTYCWSVFPKELHDWFCQAFNFVCIVKHHQAGKFLKEEFISDDEVTIAEQFLEKERVYGFFRSILPVVVDSIEKHEIEELFLVDGIWLCLRGELESFPDAVFDHFLFCFFQPVKLL